MKKHLAGFWRLLKAWRANPGAFVRAMDSVPWVCSAHEFSRAFQCATLERADPDISSSNPLWEYFQNHREGRGIWKWEHYFPIYHRHFKKFVGKKVDVLEVGIYSGGSLEMWRSYFGDHCHVYGVDIEEACKAYENEHVTVFVGDQSDRGLWRSIRSSVEGIDILIDDGGHTPEQQQTTLEEMLRHLRPGGVYLCEDLDGSFNGFSAFASGLVNELNAFSQIPGPLLQSGVTQFQAAVHSIHFYPYVVVIERHAVPPSGLSAPKHGTEWQPFFDTSRDPA